MDMAFFLFVRMDELDPWYRRQALGEYIMVQQDIVD